MKIQPVTAQYIAQVWPRVEKFIDSALDYSQGDYSAEHAKVYLTNGKWHLFVAIRNEKIIGAAIVEFINRPNDRVAFVVAIGGRLISNSQSFFDFGELLKLYGATKLEGAARDSVARLWQSKFGFSEKYKIVEVSL